MRLAVLLIACASPALPDQDRAMAITWRGVYAMVADPPSVEWVPHGQISLDCTGRTLLGTGIVVACGPGCLDPIPTTAFAHELMHWKCYQETGDVDAAHGHCDWSLVERANRAMGAAGLD